MLIKLNRQPIKESQDIDYQTKISHCSLTGNRNHRILVPELSEYFPKAKRKLMSRLF